MALLQVVLFLMMCAVALGWVARHFRFPYPIALVIGGGALGFVPRLQQLQFDPQFLLVLVLPPILYQAALLTSWRDFKANIRPIGLLAIGLVIVTTFAVAAVLTGAFSLWQASLEFVGVAVGGVVVGVLMARLFVFIHRYLGDAFIEVLTTLAVPYVAYILAESLHLSGVLAVAAAGLVRGRYAPEIVSAEMRIIARSVWNLLVFLLSSLIFFLIGTFVSVVAVIVRFAWVYPATYLSLMFRASLGQFVAPPVEGEVFIMAWCGMRGIVSLAAALALPPTLADGNAFPERDLIIFLTFVVIAVTLVVQGLSLKPLIRRLKLGRDWSLQEEQQRAKMALGKAAIAAIDAVAAKDEVPNELAERIRAEFAEKITLSVPGGLMLSRSGADDARRLRAAAVKAERQELIRLWRENQISDEVLHYIEEDLDYQESRI